MRGPFHFIPFIYLVGEGRGLREQGLLYHLPIIPMYIIKEADNRGSI